MSYAIRNDGKGWRAVADASELAAGETFSATLPQSVSSDVPSAVYSWQMRRALSQQGLRDVVEAAVAQSSQDVQDMWQFTTEHHRDNPMVAQIAQAIGKTEDDIDALFILAGSIA
jgi:predicted lipid carrier protein YhbT